MHRDWQAVGLPNAFCGTAILAVNLHGQSARGGHATCFHQLRREELLGQLKRPDLLIFEKSDQTEIERIVGDH